MNAYDRRVLWVIAASFAARVSVELGGVVDVSRPILWILIFVGCWLARKRLPAWPIITAALANVLFAAGESRSSWFLACAVWFTCAALGLLALEQRRERERSMLLQSTDPPNRHGGGATFALTALLCTIPLYLFVPKPTGWLLGDTHVAATPETRPDLRTPDAMRQSESVRDAPGEPMPDSSSPDTPGSMQAPIAPARPEDGTYRDEFGIDAVTRDKGLANAVVLYVKSSRPLYLRGRVYDRFENDRWRREPRPFEDHALERGTLELATPRRGVDPIRQNVEVVRTLDATLLHAPGLRFLRFPGASVRRYADDVFVTPQALPARTAYSVESELTLMERRYALAGPGAVPLGTYLDTTDLSARQRALAQRVIAGSSGAREKAFALEAFLRREYSYSYETIPQQGYTPLDRFLFETKRGHCEYFASALAMLLRAVDVPSRVATGFSLFAPNPITGYYEVKALDGHAWVEAFVDGHWIMLEPTPFYPLPRHRGEEQVADQLDDYLGRLAQTHELLDPDSFETRAIRFAHGAWQGMRAITRAIAQVPAELGWIFPVALVLGVIATAVAYLALLALGDWLANRELRATLARTTATNRRAATLLTARALEATAAPRGFERHEGASFREYLATLEDAGYTVPGAFADEFDTARYGVEASDQGEHSLREVRELIELRLAVDPWPRARRAARGWRSRVQDLVRR